MRSYSSREVIRMLEADGWYCVKTVGDPWQFKHPTKPGKATITTPSKTYRNGL